MAARSVASLPIVALAAYGLASAVTDRWAWSQWLWWIPWWAWFALALPGALICLWSRTPIGTLQRTAGIAAAGILLAGGVARDVRPASRFRAAADGISIIHWNASWPDSIGAEPSLEPLLERGADLYLISNPYRFFNDGRIDAWRAAGYDVVTPGLYAVASRAPILEARTLFAAPEGSAAWVVIDTSRTFGRPLSLLLVDLPSKPNLPRSELAERFVAHLARAGIGPEGLLPDLVAGDCNVTRGSASLARLAPGFRHAWDDAGAGWGASWPRRRPVLHLDHMLLGPRIVSTGYRLFDPKSGDHLAQECVLRLRNQ